MFRRRADSPPGPSTHHTVSPHATPDALRHTQHHTGTIADTAPYHAHTSPDRPPLHHARAGMCMGGALTVCPPPPSTRHARHTPPHATTGAPHRHTPSLHTTRAPHTTVTAPHAPRRRNRAGRAHLAAPPPCLLALHARAPRARSAGDARRSRRPGSPLAGRRLQEVAGGRREAGGGRATCWRRREAAERQAGGGRRGTADSGGRAGGAAR